MFEEYRKFTLGVGKDLGSPIRSSRVTPGLLWPVVDGTRDAVPLRGRTRSLRKEGLGRALLQGEGLRREGRVLAAPVPPAGRVPDEEYPFWLTTGRVLEHWHTGSMTRRTSRNCIKRMPAAYVELNRADAMQRLSISNGSTEFEGGSSRRGEMILTCDVIVDGRGKSTPAVRSSCRSSTKSRLDQSTDARCDGQHQQRTGLQEMRSERRSSLALAAALLLGICGVACDRSSSGGDSVAYSGAGAASGKNSATVRAARRAYDGAPPVRPHANFGMTCTECHNREGRQVDGVGFAPPSPHEQTQGLSALSHCAQCHVEQQSAEPWKLNQFVGLPQDLRSGRRLAPGAPPVMPHSLFMRENCQACHTGPAAREEIRTSHPERPRCVQCHAEQRTDGEFQVDG